MGGEGCTTLPSSTMSNCTTLDDATPTQAAAAVRAPEAAKQSGLPMMKPQFWRSAGKHLLERDAQGWLKVTPCLLRAYYARPELQPIATSCSAEIGLHEGLMADPLRSVAEAELAAIADQE